MGQSIDKTSFTPVDFERFEEKLHYCLEALDSLLARPGFGQGSVSIGAELELYLVDGRGGRYCAIWRFRRRVMTLG